MGMGMGMGMGIGIGIGNYIKVIGRGKDGARALTRAQAAD